MKRFLLLPFLLSPALVFCQATNSSRAKTAASQMTLEEKARFVVGMGMNIPGIDMGNGPAVGVTKDKVPGAAGTTFSIPRLGINTSVLADGPAGLRIEPYRKADSSKTYFATAFPVGTLLASSWDTSLVSAVGKAMGNEVKEYGVDILLAPALNIQRNPLGGRNFEYYSEDPVVAGNIAAAMVNGIESNGVGTSIKHFAANNQETNRNLVNTVAGERALREIYLRGFEIAVKKSQPWTVMSSYNKINGTYTSQTYDLLTTILRKEWGFKGFVMTDWFGGDNAVEQMKAGNDLVMPGTPKQVKEILDAVNNKQLDEKVLTENVERILTVLYDAPNFNNYAFSNTPDLKAHALIAHAAAAEGMVLLKNMNNALPLKPSQKKIAAFGNTSYDFISGGTGSGDVNEAYTISLVDGLKNTGLVVNMELQQQYKMFTDAEKAKQPKKKFFFELLPPLPEMPVSDDLANAKAASDDIAIITIGRNAGEFQDRKKENDYYLADAEKQLIKTVSKAFHAKGKKVIVIINSGGIIDVAEWRDNVDGILVAWQGGQEAGNAVADILTGKVNPSGKLTATFPMRYEDDPTSKNFPGKNLSDTPEKGIGGFSKGFPSEVVYEEGIYVGYRYYNSFNVKPAYEFGYGLSYTQFKYSNLKLSSNEFNESITATIDITNTGNVAGKEVVELYLSAPAGNLSKPFSELKGFSKTALLQPRQTETITFTLQPKDLASFDTSQTAWIAEAGKYNMLVGASSLDTRQQASFTLGKTLVVEKVNKVMSPLVPINELKK
jgi:beta-glucosidase